MNEAVSAEDTRRFGGRFTEWTPLARGAEGHLFRVRDRWTGHVAALKIADSPVARASVAAEYHLLGMFAHPCLIESRDLVRDGGDVAHLLEFVPAVPAERLWEEGGESAVWAALTQSLRGLACLHRRGFVHGDVAPGNLLVWREGERWRAKVADLGLALPLDRARAAGVRGTPGYMAPEVARGEGASPAADLFALALTAVTWIDGRHPLEGASPAEVLRRLAAGTLVPSPRRVVSREMVDLITRLGDPDPAARGFGVWDDLRAREDAWGPAVLHGGVHGLERPLAEWGEWARNLSTGRAGGIVVRGRVGSGRKTLCRAMARLLVEDGWTALSERPLETVRDRLEISGGDPDPVTLARELVDRFAGRDAVVLWPERAGDLESRLLRAFVVSREEEGSGSRTCVLKAVSATEDDPDGAWILTTTRSIAASWPGPDIEALLSLRDDLFSEEEGSGVAKTRPEVGAGASPLSLVRLRQVGSVSGAALTDEAMSAEVVKTWSEASDAARDVLALLTLSERGWRWESLARVLDLDADSVGRVQRELGALALTRQDHDRGELQERLADWLVKGALEGLAGGRFEGGRLAEIARELEGDSELHPGDLSLVRALVEHGRYPTRYVENALEAALREGRYEAAIGFWESVRAGGRLDAAHHRTVWVSALRAVQRLGRFPQEVLVLEDLLDAAPEDAEATEWRKMLAAARFALGDWQGAVRECELLAGSAAISDADRSWALIQKAEFLWQTGRFEEADGVYEGLDRSALPRPGLLLRYFVGRARQAGQRLDPAGMRNHLERAEALLGTDACHSDPLFLHAYAGLMLKSGEQLAGTPIAAKAERLAGESRLWTEYVMIASRAGLLALESGRVRHAYGLGKKATAVALALGSERMFSMAASFLGAYEVYLGLAGSALKRRDALLRTAEKLDDAILMATSHRLGLYVGGHLGLRDLMLESKAALERRFTPNFAPIIAEQEGLLESGADDWETARHHFGRAVDGYRNLGQWDAEAACRVYASSAEFRLGHHDAALAEFRGVREFFEGNKFPFFKVRYLLIGCEIDPTIQSSAADVAFQEMQKEGRLTDMVIWASTLLERCSAGYQMKVREAVLDAITRVADSLESATLRREFLSFPRTTRALRALQRT